MEDAMDEHEQFDMHC